MKHLDFETRSRADLKKLGGRKYWEHPSTEVICAVLYDDETDVLTVWRPGDPCPLRPGDRVTSHNAEGFERHGYDRLGWRGVEWIDTAVLARRAGLPGGLDAIAQRLLGVEKDMAGNKLTLSLSRVSRAKATFGQLPQITEDKFARVVEYCASDVDIQATLYTDHLADWEGTEDDWENRVYAAHLDIIDTGIGFDTDLARALLKADARNAEAIAVEVGRELGVSADTAMAMARSPQQFCEATGAPNAQAETVVALTHPLARLRMATATIAAGKFRAGLLQVGADGRLRDTQKYYGAHTGRWSGQGMQLQNLPRPTDAFSKLTDDDVCRLADGILAGKVDATQEQIEGLVRGTLIAAPGHRLIARDFSGVEARALAWAAGDEAALDVFQHGKQPYRVMAAQIFGDPYEAIAKGSEKYAIGKIAELACGYGQGHRKFYENNAAALDAAGVSAASVVAAWRSLHAPIVRFWYALEHAFKRAATGRVASAGPYTFEPGSNGSVLAVLPSGRLIVYPDVHVTGEGISYQGRKFREKLYGGKIAENVTQACCRDFLADVMVRGADLGWRMVLTVHDELVIEVHESEARDADAEMAREFARVPDWAEGFPVGSEGFICRRYRK